MILELFWWLVFVQISPVVGLVVFRRVLYSFNIVGARERAGVLITDFASVIFLWLEALLRIISSGVEFCLKFHASRTFGSFDLEISVKILEELS